MKMPAAERRVDGEDKVKAASVRPVSRLFPAVRPGGAFSDE